jgi:hypothetical protein
MAIAAGIFRPGGDFYTTFPDLVLELHKILPELLPKSEVVASLNATFRIIGFLVQKARAGELNELVTDKVIAAETGVSERNVQRALYVLDVVLRKIGKPIIDRMRTHGRRIISFVRGFAARGQTAPPCTPLKTSETTTTSEPSSSLDFQEEKPPKLGVIIPPGMIDRAFRLIPKVTEGRVIDAVSVYGADWVSRALDVVEKRNSKSGMQRVRSWGFVLNTLKNWKREGSAPPVDPPPTPPPVKAKTEPAPEEPPHRLMPAEVAELLARCQSGNRIESNFARIQLRQALAVDIIPAELVATIPAELKGPTKPRAP